MKINKYEYHQEKDLSYSPVNLSSVNLVVGISGAGKSRFINTLFNLALFASNERNIDIRDGHWNIAFSENNHEYNWLVSIQKGKVDREELNRLSDDKYESILTRDKDRVTYRNNKIVKLRQEKLSTLLLNEDELIEVRKGFSSFYQRKFSEHTLNEAMELGFIDPSLSINNLSFTETSELFSEKINLRLFYLKKKFEMNFNFIKENFREVFPFVSDLSISEDNPIFPLPVVKEKGIQKPIPITELSSGMKKILLFLTDLTTMKKSSVYLIDEYENSLGVNAIDFLPELIYERSEDIQFIITSHHPYIINNIPIENWLVFNRKGSRVNIIQGQEALERYGKSKQDAFIKLINDPLFTHEDL